MDGPNSDNVRPNCALTFTPAELRVKRELNIRDRSRWVDIFLSGIVATLPIALLKEPGVDQVRHCGIAKLDFEVLPAHRRAWSQQWKV